MTGPASSTASSSTTRSASATACRTRPSSPWTSSTSAGPIWPSGSSTRTGRRRPTSGRASLEHHHVAYRAQVRAKVAAIRAAQGDDAQRRGGPPAPRTGSRTTSALAACGSCWSAGCPAPASPPLRPASNESSACASSAPTSSARRSGPLRRGRRTRRTSAAASTRPAVTDATYERMRQRGEGRALAR